MKGLLKRNKGITLVELMIVLGLIGLLTTLIYSLILFSNRSYTFSSERYDVQGEVRLAIDAVMREVRFATSLEIIDVDEAKDQSQYEEGYSYIYVEGGSLYNVMYDEETKGYKVSSYNSHIQSETSKFSKLTPNILKIVLSGHQDNQSYLGETELSLLNFPHNGSEIIGTEGLGLKYKRNSSNMILDEEDA